MKFFHYTNVDAMVLSPQVGSNRHAGEDPRAVGKAVVWLSDRAMTVHPPMTFECEVELDPADPLLSIDEPFQKMAASMQRAFGTDDTPLWYWYQGSVTVSTRRVWDAATGRYI